MEENEVDWNSAGLGLDRLKQTGTNNCYYVKLKQNNGTICGERDIRYFAVKILIAFQLQVLCLLKKFLNNIYRVLHAYEYEYIFNLNMTSKYIEFSLQVFHNICLKNTIKSSQTTPQGELQKLKMYFLNS
ncbi:hypothetical protein GQX74_008345 [Glossina fuscipes]|nr:hypothetical protein GQX74_008345 [Glossina fuscipes]